MTIDTLDGRNAPKASRISHLEEPRRPALSITVDHRKPVLAPRDWVQVKSASEILASLDANGRLDGLPPMPELLEFVGQRLQVSRRVEKTCVEGYALRGMSDALILQDVRCNGAAHDGCERRCAIFWKDAWLRAEGEPAPVIDPAVEAAARQRLNSLPVREGALYQCQSTSLGAATGPIFRWNYVPLVRDVLRGELSLGGFFEIIGRTALNRFRAVLKTREIGLILGVAEKPDRGDLGLKPGDKVRIRTTEQIRATLDKTGRNRGLTFEPEMSLHIGKVYEVDYQVSRIIHEETGKMIPLTHTVVLKGLNCRGVCMKNCPRANPLYWREAWLERV
jgi:hypothetical protein